jgi:hypothetical protein
MPLVRGGYEGPLSPDYLVYRDGTSCCARNLTNGEVEYSGTNHAVVIQNAINAAGEGKAIEFRAGVYNITTALIPAQDQTWYLNGAIFRPVTNNRILNITSRDRLSFHGTLTIEDPDALSDVEAILIEDMAFCYFEHISIRNYYRGISMTGTSGGTHENYFGDVYMQVRDRGLNLETSCHDNHFNHLWIKGPSPEQWATGPGLRIATNGTQGGNTFDQIEILDMQTGMDLPGAFEAWFQRVIVDNAYGNGIYIGGGCERLFFGTVWTASGGDGIVIEGNDSAPPTSYADKIYFDKVYSWLNAGYGVRFKGYSTNIAFGMLVVQRNDKGLVFEGATNYDIIIGKLISLENTTVGVDGTGASDNIFIERAIIRDAVNALDNVWISGVRPGAGLFRNSGVATIPSGQSSVNVAHGLETTPRLVLLDLRDAETASAYISARDQTTFTIAVPSPVSSDRQIGWVAESRRQ